MFFSGFLTSVSYRSNTGKERKKKSRGRLLTLTIWQIQVQFYQLFATVMRWSLENLKEIDKNYRSFDERVKIFFWNFLDFFGYFWNFLEKCVPVKNLSIWFHGVNALLFPTVLSHSELRKTIFFRIFGVFYLIKKNFKKSTVLSFELLTMCQKLADTIWKWTLKRVLLCKSENLRPRSSEIWLIGPILVYIRAKKLNCRPGGLQFSFFARIYTTIFVGGCGAL